MLNPLPLSQWLSAPRPDDTPVAWQDDHLWTLGDLRHDVTQLVDTLRREDGERWALCIENGYLFIVALLATLHAGKTPVLPGHSRAIPFHRCQPSVRRARSSFTPPARPARRSG